MDALIIVQRNMLAYPLNMFDYWILDIGYWILDIEWMMRYLKKWKAEAYCPVLR